MNNDVKKLTSMGTRALQTHSQHTFRLSEIIMRTACLYINDLLMVMNKIS